MPPTPSPAGRDQPPLSCYSSLHASPDPHPSSASPRLHFKRVPPSCLGSFPFLCPPSKAPHGQTPLPVAFLTAPTVGAPPLTGNSTAPPMPSPLRGESHHRAPTFPFLQLGSTLTSPLLLPSRRSASGQRRPPSGLPPPPIAVTPNSLRHPTVAPPPW
jgi:hypothetical protein